MMRLRISIAVLLACALSSCAGLNVTPIGTSMELDKAAHGFRYYQPAPYLFVYSDGKGGLISQIKYLPDTTQKMSAQPYAYLAINESTLQFDGGMLTQAATVVDETVVPAAALDSLAKVLAAAAKAAMNVTEETNDTSVPVPYLFKIVVKGNVIELKGGPMNGAALDPDGKRKMVIKATIGKKEGK